MAGGPTMMRKWNQAEVFTDWCLLVSLRSHSVNT